MAVTPERELVLTEQYRPPVDAVVIELPAGLVGDEPDTGAESGANAAHRELEEETGYRAGDLTRLGRGPSSAGMSSEVIDFYLARNLTRTGPGGGTESEDIAVRVVPLSGLRAWLADRTAEGRLIDPKVYAGIWFLEGL
ncbi:MAG: NUDIX hydrolase [Xanthomonadales bacterium]|nr:NUDIX hydrolase [Xanthomonadales bacterium]